MIFLARFLFFPLAVSGVILSDDDSSLYFSFFETHQILCRIFYTSRSRTATPSAWLCELLGRWCATEAPRQVAALAVWTSRNRCKWLHRRWWWQVYRRSQRSGTFILFQLQLQLPSSSRCAVTFPLGWERRRRRRFFLFKSKAIQQENTTTNGVASLLLLYIPTPPSYELGASRSEWHSHQQPIAWWRRDGTVAEGGRIRIFAAGLNEKSPINAFAFSPTASRRERRDKSSSYFDSCCIIPQFSIRASLIPAIPTYILHIFFSLFSIYCGIRRESVRAAAPVNIRYLSLFIRFQ